MTIQKERFDSIPQLGDVVKIISVKDKVNDILISEKGIIIDIDMEHEFPYNIRFTNQSVQRFNESLGELLWKRENFAVLSYD